MRPWWTSICVCAHVFSYLAYILILLLMELLFTVGLHVVWWEKSFPTVTGMCMSQVWSV